LLPDFGEGFVQLCLEYFDCDTEKVVNALLEGIEALPRSRFYETDSPQIYG
jgi:hypothetical protein